MSHFYFDAHVGLMKGSGQITYMGVKLCLKKQVKQAALKMIRATLTVKSNKAAAGGGRSDKSCHSIKLK